MCCVLSQKEDNNGGNHSTYFGSKPIQQREWKAWKNIWKGKQNKGTQRVCELRWREIVERRNIPRLGQVKKRDAILVEETKI